MVRGLEQDRIEAWARLQQAEITLRNQFLRLERPTQQKIVDVLATMENFIEKNKSNIAQKYFFRLVNRQDKSDIDQNGIDWYEVRRYILQSCFSDRDMEGYAIMPRRVGSQISVFRALMDLPREIEDF